MSFLKRPASFMCHRSSNLGRRMVKVRMRTRLSAAGAALALVGVSALVTATMGGGNPSTAAPGNPGVPQPGVIVYAEDFSSGEITGSGATITTPLGIEDYTGVQTDPYTGTSYSETYSADTSWSSSANNCNGWILRATDATSTDPGCLNGGGADNAGNAHSAWYYLTAMVDALGAAQGQTNPATNNAVASMTNLPISGPSVPMDAGAQFITSESIPVVPGHYYIASAYFAASHCKRDAGPRAWTDPSEAFALLENGSLFWLSSGLNPCTSTVSGFSPWVYTEGSNKTNVYVTELQSAALQIPSDGSVTHVGIEIYNAVNANVGNDVAFDLPELIDVTPQLDKSFSPDTITAGGTSTLTFTITNTDELGAKDDWSFTDELPTSPGQMTVADPLDWSTTCATGTTVDAAGGDTSIKVSGNLAAGSESCTVTVKVTATTPGDYENKMPNTDSGGLLPPDPATLSVTAPPNVPVLTLTKTASVKDAHGASLGAGPATAADDVVTYTFEVKNVGTGPATDVTIDDAGAYTDTTQPGFSGSGTLGSISSCSPISLPGTLAADESTTCTASYTVTQADIDAGDSILNTATASGTAPDDSAVTSSPADATVEVSQDPQLTLDKSASPNDALTKDETLTYSFTVTNSGNVTVHGISIDDGDAYTDATAPGFSGTGTLSAVDCPDTTLDPGAVTICTATYTVTQADVNAGHVYNTAQANGLDPSDNPVASNLSPAEVPGAPDPKITLAKSHETLTGTVEAGDTVTFLFDVTNSGNVTLSDVGVTDTMVGLSSPVACPGTGQAWPDTANEGVLQPGESVTCDATYTLTQPDIDAGSLANPSATVTGTAPGGSAVTDEAFDTVDLPAAPSLSADKSADPTTFTAAGQTIAYTVTVPTPAT